MGQGLWRNVANDRILREKERAEIWGFGGMEVYVRVLLARCYVCCMRKFPFGI